MKKNEITQIILGIFFLIFSSTDLTAQEKKSAKDQLKEDTTITGNYVHKWTKFPSLSGESVFSRGKETITPTYGTAMVVFFISFANIPTQNMMEDIQRMQKKYEALYTEFVYVFSHDQLVDARGFAREFGMEGKAILADQETLEKFKNPQIPSAFVSDRSGWLNLWFAGLNKKKLVRLDDFLSKQNSI